MVIFVSFDDFGKQQFCVVANKFLYYYQRTGQKIEIFDERSQFPSENDKNDGNFLLLLESTVIPCCHDDKGKASNQVETSYRILHDRV